MTSPLRMLGTVAGVLGGIIAVWIVVEFFLLRGETPPVINDAGDHVPGSVATLEKISLGGVDQWILIRGADSTKPLLLFLHGTPDVPIMMLAHAFQAPLESHFVVVQWDRPGTGRSRGVGNDRAFSVVLSDIHQLSEYLLHRFGQERLFLVGHSWGGLLGLHAVAERPQLYAAFIGTGQGISDSLARYVAQRRFLFNMGRAHNDQELVRRLMRGESDLISDLFRYGAGLRGSTSAWPILLTGFRTPEYDLLDVLSVFRSDSRTPFPVGSPPNEAPVNFDVPVFYLLGRHDYVAPSLLAAEQFRGFQAPLKELVWFEYSAHFPFWEEQRKFAAEILRIRNLVVSHHLQHQR